MTEKLLTGMWDVKNQHKQTQKKRLPNLFLLLLLFILFNLVLLNPGYISSLENSVDLDQLAYDKAI